MYMLIVVSFTEIDLNIEKIDEFTVKLTVFGINGNTVPDIVMISLFFKKM